MVACQHRKNINEKALAFDKRAANVFSRNFGNPDSLNFALSLIDSAIKIQPDYVSFYSMKISILYELKRYDQIITVYDRILQLQKNNYFFLMGKGITFEHLNKLDSADYYYHLAFDHFDDVKWKSGADREVEKVILYGILKDTINFKAQLDIFRKKYSTEKNYALMYEYLKTFDRDELINGKSGTSESHPVQDE